MVNWRRRNLQAGMAVVERVLTLDLGGLAVLQLDRGGTK